MATKRKSAPAPVITKEQYDAMSPAERRVALARDVLALLDARRIQAASTYWASDHGQVGIETFVADPKCEVCARGAFAVAWARAADDFQGRGLVEAWDLHPVASYGARGFKGEVFGDATEIWKELEDAFEGYHAYNDEGSEPDPNKVRWFRKHRSASARLRAICENLIVNNGDFIPVPAAGGAT